RRLNSMNTFSMNLAKYLAYNAQANNLFLKNLQEFKDPPEVKNRLSHLMAHILFAQYVWAARVEGWAPRFLPLDVERVILSPPAESEEGHQEPTMAHLDLAQWSAPPSFPEFFNEVLLRKFQMLLETIPGDTWVHYKNLQGASCRNIFSDIVLHVCNHGTHHRAQMALLMRQAGFQPPASDYILFARSGGWM
ncbi:MAG: hypothetical protein N2050_00225, partial [Flavobacteriales bacterium]|nr:hypothetical protein [Flavobacteriales bacterium]